MERTVLGAVLDVAIACLGRRRDDSERDEAALFGRWQSHTHGLLKRGDVTNDVVGGKHEQNRIGRV